MSMIFPFIADGCFDPEATKIMGEVFDEMITSLDRFGRPRIIQEAVARHILDAMRDGERDPDVVYQRVLAAMALKLGVAGESHEGASLLS
jgi:hypothetical protein